jgi:hypothetical protein
MSAMTELWAVQEKVKKTHQELYKTIQQNFPLDTEILCTLRPGVIRTVRVASVVEDGSNVFLVVHDSVGRQYVINSWSILGCLA